MKATPRVRLCHCRGHRTSTTPPTPPTPTGTLHFVLGFASYFAAFGAAGIRLLTY